MCVKVVGGKWGAVGWERHKRFYHLSWGGGVWKKYLVRLGMGGGGGGRARW